MKNKCPIKPNPLKRLNKNSEAARNLRIEVAHSEAQKAVSENRCPTCGRGVRQNNSILGWVQCEQFGAEQFRKYPTQPACNWQGFTR